MFVACFAPLLWALTAGPVLEQVRADFHRLERHCDPGGVLWGVSLCGRVLVADFERGRLYASEPDPEATLVGADGVYAGPLPPSLPRANTAVSWQGRRWTQVLWPLPDDPRERLRLLGHESFHRVQPELGLEGAEGGNSHLSEPAGRLWLRLEWRALARALSAAETSRALADALAFRDHRHGLYPAARTEEWALERNEGLAEYTGLRLAYPGGAARARAAAALREADAWEPLSRRFAYASGPAWGLLLDDCVPDWRRRVRAGADLVAVARDCGSPATYAGAGEIRQRALAYGFDEIDAEERALARQREAEHERLRALLLGPDALVLPLAEPQLAFDPGAVTALPPDGSVYHGLTLSDRWGRIEVSGAALIAPDFSTLRVSRVIEIEAGRLAGADWTLALAEGWIYADGRVVPR